MSSSTSIEPPFAYNPLCKPTKSILKQRTVSSPTSWLARLSSPDVPTPPTSPQRPLGLFRKLVNASSSTQQAPSSSQYSAKSSLVPSTTTLISEEGELSFSELKRVRFPVHQLTTEYFPYSPRDILEEPTTTVISTPIVKQESKSTTANATTPDKILSYYETACRNKEEPMLDLFTTTLLSHQQASILTHIDLSHQKLTRCVIEPLADVLCLDFGLERLTLSNCALEDDALKVILHSLLVVNTLQHLNLSDNKRIQATGFKYISIYIKEASALETLDVSGTNPDKKGVNYFSQALCSPTTKSKLEKLMMDNCNLRHLQLETLSYAIRRSSISYLSLRNNRINQQGALSIGVMLRDYGDEASSKTTATGLQQLNLDTNDIRQGVQYIAQALRRNQSLRSLSMADCNLNAQCSASVAEALKYNQSLEVLNLSNNPICTAQQLEGVNALKQALYCNRSLTELNLSQTGLGAEATVSLAECIPENNTLCKLDLASNPAIDLAGLLALMSGLKLNSTLIFLDVDIPANDRDMVRIQSEMVALCTRNAQANENDKARTPSVNSVDTIPSSITTTQATARLTLQERLAAVTKGKGSRANSIRSIHSVENLQSSSATNSVSTPTPTPTLMSHRNRRLPQTNFEVEMGQVELLEEMLQAEQLSTDTGIKRPDDTISQVYLKCRKGLLTLNNCIPQLMDSEHLVELLALNDRLTSAIATYEELYNNDARIQPSSPSSIALENEHRLERSSTTATINVKEGNQSRIDEIDEHAEDINDEDNELNKSSTKGISELRKEKEVEEGVAFKLAKDKEGHEDTV